MEEKINQGEEKLYEVLHRLSIDYEVFEHEAFYSVKDLDANESYVAFPGLNLKCLLNKDKKTGIYYMVVLEDHRQMDGKHFKEVTGWKKTSFATADEMYEKIKLVPGSVSPYGLINNIERDVVLVLEKAIYDAADDTILNFHPCRNTATLAVKKGDFIKLIEDLGNPIIWEK